MPEELPPDRVEGPVGLLGVHEDDPDTGVLLVGVGPHVEVAIRPLGVTARGLEPRVLVAGVVHHEVGDDAYAAGVRLADELAEVLDGAEFRQHGGVVGDVVAAVTQGRGIEGRQPDAVDTEPLDVVELGDHPLEVAGPRAGRIREGPGEQFVEDGRLEPLRVTPEAGDRARAGGEARHLCSLLHVRGQDVQSIIHHRTVNGYANRESVFAPDPLPLSGRLDDATGIPSPQHPQECA